MLIFVYGTLKSNHCRNHVLAQCECLGEAITQPMYRMYSWGAFPAMVEDEHGRAIHGEVWDVSPEILARLDHIEGIARGFYTRKSIQLMPPFDGLKIEGYLCQESMAGKPDCGDCWTGN